MDIFIHSMRLVFSILFPTWRAARTQRALFPKLFLLKCSFQFLKFLQIFFTLVVT